MTRVIVLADTAEAAADFAALIAEDDRIEVIKTASVGASRVLIERGDADVMAAVCVDPSEIPDLHIPVVVLAAGKFEDWRYPARVKACLPIEITPQEGIAALIAAAEGLTVLTPRQAELLLPEEGRVEQLAEALTRRELEVLRAMAEGLSNKEIAEQLGISDHTAKFHVTSILTKLGVSSRTEAVVFGMRHGLLPI